MFNLDVNRLTLVRAGNLPGLPMTRQWRPTVCDGEYLANVPTMHLFRLTIILGEPASPSSYS
jgi:hypothetical protein